MKPRLPERLRQSLAVAARAVPALAANVAAAAVLAAVASTAQAAPPPAMASAAAPKPVEQAIDINSATLAQLQTLPGIGRDEAARIVSARPYRTKADLATKGVLPTGAYLALRHRIVALPPAAMRAAKGRAS